MKIAIAAAGLVSSLSVLGTPTFAQTDDYFCYMVETDGDLVDLMDLCGGYQPISQPDGPTASTAFPLDASGLPNANGNSAILRESGVLAPGDALASDGTFYDEFQFIGSAGQFVTATLESQEFDTYLVILDSAGNVVAESDDISFDNTNSEASFTLPSSGSYLVIVNAFFPADQGNYTLTVR